MCIAFGHGWSDSILALPAEPWLYHQKMGQMLLEGSMDHSQFLIDRVISCRTDNTENSVHKHISNVQNAKIEAILFPGKQCLWQQKLKI